MGGCGDPFKNEQQQPQILRRRLARSARQTSLRMTHSLRD
jgi:hypothetical protein